MTEIRLPQYGMGMTDGTIVKWFVAADDSVQKGQPLCEVEAAKTNVKLESPVPGTVTKILITLDQKVPVNTPLLDIDKNGIAVPLGDATATATSPVAEQSGITLASVEGSSPNGPIRRADVPGAEPDPAGTGAPRVQIEPRARQAPITSVLISPQFVVLAPTVVSLQRTS